MPLFEIETPDGSFEVEAPDEMSAVSAISQLGKGRGHDVPEFRPIGVEGYDPITGEVDNAVPSRIGAVLSSTLEGIPIAGPILQRGVENTAAGIGALLSGKPQRQVRSEMGEMVDKSQSAYPYSAAAGNVAGAILGTVPMIAAAPAAFGVGMSLPAATAASAISGAAIGGTDAAVRSGGDLDAVRSGAMWGGGFGLVGPTAGKLVGNAVGSIASRLKSPSGISAPSGAQRAIARAAASDSIDDVTGRLASSGDAAMPMDLGPNLQRQAGALAAIPGKGQEIIRSAIAGRQQGAGSRIAAALDDALGQSVDTLAVADDIIARRSASAKPLYDVALAKTVPFTPELKQLISRPSLARALKKAQALSADEGIAMKVASQAPSGKPSMSAADALAKLNRKVSGQERRAVSALAPSAGKRPPAPMRLSDFVAAQGGILDHAGEAAAVAGGAKSRFGRIVRPDAKRSLDYMREAAEEAGYLGGYTQDEFGRASVDDFLRALDDDLRSAPVYAQENMTEAGALEVWEAAQAGRNSVRNSADRVGQEIEGSVADDVFERATRLVGDGVDPDDALRTAIADDIAENGIAPQEVPAGWFAEVSDDGMVKVRRPPTTRDLHYTKMALDDMIQVAKQGGNGNEARVYTQLKEQLLGMMDSAVPEYASARKAFSGPSAVLDAIEDGKTVFSRKVSPSQLLRDMAKMNVAEREAFQQGARASVADIMGTARNDALAARNAFSSGYNKEKLELIVGKENATKMLRAIDNEALFTRTRDVVTGNSETAARLAAMQEVGAGSRSPGIIKNAANMRFGDVLTGLGDKVFGAAKTAAQSKLNAELAQILTGKGSIGEALKVSRAAQARGEITAAQARQIANAILLAASPSRNALMVSP